MIPHLNAVVLAGGAGQRLWPLSRELSPKQLLKLHGRDSLIVQAINRVRPFVEQGSTMVVTNERLFDELRNHLTAQDDERLRQTTYLIEPLPRNTAPAIAYAAATLVQTDPDALMVVLPSDHLLESGPLWADCLESGAALANDGYLVTIGITPSRPETGYGYIRAGELLAQYARGDARPLCAAQFVEKPELARAQQFVESGEYFWNAGIFVFKAATVLAELDVRGGASARIAETALWLAKGRAAGQVDDDTARERFSELESLSVDFAVMEHSEKVAVIPANLEWSDVGSLIALAESGDADANGNVRHGRGVDVDSERTIVYATDRLVATLGVEDMIVVDTTDATLVLPKSRAQDVRLVVEALRATGADEIVAAKESMRPWGWWSSLLKGPGYQIKQLHVEPHRKLSLQKHAKRSEHWVVVEGVARVTCDDKTFDIEASQSAFVPLGSVHRLENPGEVPLKVIEVAVGEYVGEDDIVRLEDDWQRDR